MHELKGREKWKEMIKMQDAKIEGFEEACSGEGTLELGFEQWMGQRKRQRFSR